MPNPATKRSTAEYIAEMTKQLSAMARDAEMLDVAYALDVASATAGEVVAPDVMLKVRKPR